MILNWTDTLVLWIQYGNVIRFTDTPCVSVRMYVIMSRSREWLGCARQCVKLVKYANYIAAPSSKQMTVNIRSFVGALM